MLSDALLRLQETTSESTELPVDPGAQGGSDSGFLSFTPFILIGVIFYFLLIRPERKNRQNREKMLTELSKGDEVMTSSGMYGKILTLKEDTVTLQVADGVKIKFSRAAIQGLAEPKEPSS